MITRNLIFPQQKVSESEKLKPEWYQNCIDYIIDTGISLNDRSETDKKLDILHGNIPQEFYKKTLNPYNTNNERLTRFPATMRNYDIMTDIVRRYVSEYFKGVHEFVVGADNPDIIAKKNAKFRERLLILAQQAFQQEVEKRLAELQKQIDSGQQQDSIDPSQLLPDPEEFTNQFNANYIDDESKQAQDVLNYIRHITDDVVIYLSAYFNFCALGECYTYTDIRGEEFIKECIPVNEAYPIPNNKFFVEDHDMFARKTLMSYNTIMDMFKDSLSKEDKEFLNRYYSISDPSNSRTQFLYSQYFEYFPDACAKFGTKERDLFRHQPVSIAYENTNLFEVWHVVWKGLSKRGIVTYMNPMGFGTTKVVEDGYVLNPELGDISIEWKYETQIYEGYRIGTRWTGVYPIKARPIPYQRHGKLPYNGIMEVLPNMGKFSIIDILTPYQVLRNILYYHRELIIAKNKGLILLVPESLISSDAEDKVYKMAADGVLLVDDSDDFNSQKMANIRMLNASLGSYITELTNLIESIKAEARECVDMNIQRYGQIAQSAGKGVTEEAIARSSMGSVIIVTMFDEMRKRDYARDLEFAKIAYIDGLQTSYFDDTNTRRYLSLDVNSFIYSDYGVLVKNDQKELEKIQQLKQWAFSAAQNGDLDMALAAITGDNVTQIKNTINKFTELKRQHENEIKQADQMLEQQKLQNEITKIQAKGEEDRKTEAVKNDYALGLKNVDLRLAQEQQPVDNSGELQQQQNQLVAKQEIENNRLNLERQKLQLDTYNKSADRQVKLKQLETQLKIAKENKNKYDKK